MLTQDELDRERYEAREKAKRDSLSWEKALERAQQEVQRAQQEVQRAQLESQHWQQRAQQESEHWQQRAQQESEHWQQQLQKETERLRQQAALKEEVGILIGQIQLCQQLLRQPVTPQEELQDKPFDELRQLAEQLSQKVGVNSPR